MNQIAPYWKAVMGFITPGVIVLGGALLEGSAGGSDVTQTEWITAVVAMFVTGGAVFTKANGDPTGTHQDESVQPPPY